MEAWGAPAARYRADYADADPKKVREALEKYVREVYEAGALTAHTISDSYTLNGPFRMRLEATEAGVVRTEAGGAAVTLPCGALLWRLPNDLRQPSPADPTAPAPAVAGARAVTPQ